MRFALVLLVACGAPASSPPPVTPPPVVTIGSPVCGSADACHHEAEDREADGEFAAAARAHDRACSFGETASCMAAGILWRTRVEPIDDAAAHASFAAACDLGVGDGCAQAATDLLSGTGTSRDPARALALLETACASSSGLACFNLAILTREGTFAPADATAAYALFEKACALELAAGCTEQALVVETEAGGKPRARALYEKACAASAKACFFLAAFLERERDLKRARELYDLACGAGSAPACDQLRSP